MKKRDVALLLCILIIFGIAHLVYSANNFSPLIKNLNKEIFVCENEQLSFYLDITDPDNDSLTLDIFPKNPFYTFASKTGDTYEIYSGILDKSKAGKGWTTYDEIVSVSDGQYADSRNLNITVIEINNAPSVENIGVQTVRINRNFHKEVAVSDIEDGQQSSGNFSFNLTFLDGEKFFDVDAFGKINFIANSGNAGNYNISLCVTDRSLEISHPEILPECRQTGKNISACQNFSLTVTDENHAPTITSFNPTDTDLIATEGGEIQFNITMYDPDATPLDAYLYIDKSLSKYVSGLESGGTFAELTASLGCPSFGNHTITIEVTDGELNDSINWEVDVDKGACPIQLCTARWSCGDWNTCKNSKNISGWSQERECIDINNCTSTLNKPSEIQQCSSTENPSCFDGIKNCHDNSCEILADCGGPCSPCPTCSDKIQNQGEESIDCGGPCQSCGVEKLKVSFPITYILVFVAIVLLILLAIRLAKIYRMEREIQRFK